MNQDSFALGRPTPQLLFRVAKVEKSKGYLLTTMHFLVCATPTAGRPACICSVPPSIQRVFATLQNIVSLLLYLLWDFFFLSFCVVDGLSLFLSKATFPLGISLHGGIHGGGRTQWRVSKNRATRKQKHFFSWIFSSFIFFYYFLCSRGISSSFSPPLSLSSSSFYDGRCNGHCGLQSFSSSYLSCVLMSWGFLLMGFSVWAIWWAVFVSASKISRLFCVFFFFSHVSPSGLCLHYLLSAVPLGSWRSCLISLSSSSFRFVFTLGGDSR